MLYHNIIVNNKFDLKNEYLTYHVYIYIRLNICDKENCPCKRKSNYQDIKYEKFEKDIILRNRKFIRNCYAPNPKMRVSITKLPLPPSNNNNVKSSIKSVAKSPQVVLCSHQFSENSSELSRYGSNRRCSCCQRKFS